MRVSLNWLKELVEYNLLPKELAEILSLRSIGVKQITEDFIELDLTYNRGDLLSIRGVARELAAITGSKLKFKDEPLPEYNLPKTPVKIENTKLCPIYCVAKIENLKVEESNETWVKKLSESGMRSVNNIADVTNLIMLEYGQPMHAFDARGVKDETIIVRTAKKGERLTTLDGKTRDLDTTDLLIADPLNALGIAGVMGGKDSEVSNSTTTILLEAAIFDPVQIRKTAKRLELNSEASKRFQHGLTKTNLLHALSAAIKMYQKLGGKLTAINLVGDFNEKPKTVTLTLEKVNSLIGLELATSDVEHALEKLGFVLKRTGVKLRHLEGGLGWHVRVPYWRLDIEIEEDLIEEVARMYGYEKIEGKPLSGKLPAVLDQTMQNFIHNLKKKLADAGLTEIQTYSFYSTKVIENCKLKIENLIKIANPISSETEYLRQSIWPNLLEVVAKNLKQGYRDIAIFELGKVYSPKKGALPDEKYHLAIALMNNSDNPMAELASISRCVKLTHPKGVQLGDRNLFHPTRFTSTMAEVHPRVLNKFGIDQRVAVLEIELDHFIHLEVSI